MTKACSLGVPILLRFLAARASTYTSPDQLTALVLGDLASAPDMDLSPGDGLRGVILQMLEVTPHIDLSPDYDRLWAALQQLLLTTRKTSGLLTCIAWS